MTPAARIAVFDNDGLLWAELPVYFQRTYAVDRVRAKTSADPDTLTSDVLHAAAVGNLEGMLAGGMEGLMEALAYLRDEGFQTWIVSGGGVHFVRAPAGETHGIPPEQVLGSATSTKNDPDTRSIMKLPGIAFLDDIAIGDICRPGLRFSTQPTGPRRGRGRASGALSRPIIVPPSWSW